MKISDHIKGSLQACDRKELEQAMLFACLAIDGTAKKTYPEIKWVGKRFKKFIKENLDIIELMFGGLNLQETIFPFKDDKGKLGVKFEDVVYEKHRCSLAHGNEIPDGFEINISIDSNAQSMEIDIENQTMRMPESVIYGLGLACVLAPVNSSQMIGDESYYYRDSKNKYIVDNWWGKVDSARQIMDFKSKPRIKIDFCNVWPDE